MKIIIFFCISCVVLAPLIFPFLKPGRAWTYDTDNHQYRMAAFHRAVQDGQIPPRWSSSLLYGWGSPVFSFNWSLAYWMGEPFLFAGWSVTDASKAVVILSVVLSYLAMFYLLSLQFPFWPAIAGAILYEWSLFRIYLLFTGGGLGTHTAFIFWPLLFAGVYKRSFFLICIGVVGTLLSHQVMFLMILPLFFSYIVWFSLQERNIRIMRLSLIAICGGLAITAYFWLPAFIEQGFVHIGITKDVVWHSFLNLRTVFHEPGLTDTKPPLQYWYWSTGWNLFAVVFFALIFFIRTPRKLTGMGIFILFFFIGQMLMLPVTAFLWKHVPLLADFQYPVRFQALSLFCASILGAYVIIWNKRNAIVICVLLAIVSIYFGVLAIPKNWPREIIPDSVYYSGNSNADMMGEYLPVWADIDHFFDYAHKYETHPIGRIVEGTALVESMIKRSNQLSFTVQAKTPASVVINQLYFPGWVILVNDNAVTHIERFGYGEMLIHVPMGVSRVSARFTDTPIRTLGNMITVATFLIMLFFGGKILWTNRRSVI